VKIFIADRDKIYETENFYFDEENCFIHLIGDEVKIVEFLGIKFLKTVRKNVQTKIKFEEIGLIA
jgi:hypothetical protein